MNKILFYFKYLLFVAEALVLGLPMPLEFSDKWVRGQLDEESNIAFNRWVKHYQQIVSERKWTKDEAESFIHHDKFNIADGLDVDLFIIDEMQLEADPVKVVENEMNKKRASSQS